MMLHDYLIENLVFHVKQNLPCTSKNLKIIHQVVSNSVKKSLDKIVLF